MLLADDSPERRRTLADLVRQLALSPEEAASGPEALALLARPGGPRLALLARDLPGLDGVALCSRVRALELAVRPHLIVVGAGPDLLPALQVGADDGLGWPPELGELKARLAVGLRNVQLQLDLQGRLAQLEAALQRLDVVGAAAARAAAPAPAPPAAPGTLSAAVWALEPVRRLPGRMEAVLGRLGAGAGPEGEPLLAHAALGLPDQGAWLDLVLAAGRDRLARALASLTGREAGTGAALEDSLGDLLRLVLEGLRQPLEEAGVRCVQPLRPRPQAGALAPPPGPHRLGLERGGWTLTVVESPSRPLWVPFPALTPGLVLLAPLHPPGQPEVEVLARGTLLRPGYLARARSFFPAGAGAPVEVMPASAFTLAQAG